MYSDRQAWANSVEPDEMPQSQIIEQVWLRSGGVRILRVNTSVSYSTYGNTED